MANAAVMDTTKLIIPDSYLPRIYDKITENAVIPSLITQTPQLYNQSEIIYLKQKPVTQYVEPVEGGAKESTDFAFDSKQMHKFKIQTTIRLTEDMVWANEDNTATDDQLDLIFTEMGNSLGEGVDAGMIHQFDPHTKGTITSAASVALSKVATEVNTTGKLQSDMDSLPDSIIAAGYNVSGIAFDTMYANELRKLRNADGVRLYPEVPLKVNTLGNFEGLDAVVSGNVSGRSLNGLGDTGIKAIMGDWSMAQWGIIRQIALRRFDVGDPDNRGYDLAYKNEVAYRIEMVFAFGLVFNDAFVVLRDKPTTSGGSSGGSSGGTESGTESGTETQSAKASK